MLPSFLLSLREGIEAALIIGLVLGAIRKMKRSDLSPIVWIGTLSAFAVSILSAIVLERLGASLEGQAEIQFEGITMILAASLLTWMIFWMQRQSRHIKGEIEYDVRRASMSSGKRAMFILAFFAVVREGVELAIFLTATVMASSAQATLAGALLGLLAAAMLGWLIFASTVRLNLGLFFQVTGVMLILFAAGLVAHGVHEFTEIGWLPVMIEHVWDINAYLPETSSIGQLLSTLFGYNANPSLAEILAYIGYFIAILVGLRLNSLQSTVQQKAIP